MKKLFILILSTSLLLTSCQKDEPYVFEDFFTYEQLKENYNNPRELDTLKTPISKTNVSLIHTVSEITLFDKGDEKLLDECYSLINYYECLLSSSAEKAQTSEIYKLNNSNGEKVTLSDDALECLEYGYEYSKNSRDTFDITIGALTSLWNFPDATTAPLDADIQNAVQTIDYNNLVIEGNTAYLTNSDTKIDLGGISKGFISDKVVDYLRSQGVESGIVNLGGNVYVLGYKDAKTKTPFKIGIKKPDMSLTSTEQIGYVEVNDMSIVSSGDSEQFFIDENTGNIYSHILDKSTGYPVETDLDQVTVFTEKSADGDGLSTTIYSMGSKNGMDFVESLDNVECIMVKKDDTLLTSSGINDESGKIKFTQTN